MLFRSSSRLQQLLRHLRRELCRLAGERFLLCLLLGGSGIGYVWQKNQIYQLGQQIKKREVRIAELEEQNEKLNRQLGTMRNPNFLERRIKELDLRLVQPQPSQVWRLTEPPRDLPRQGRERQFAGR